MATATQLLSRQSGMSTGSKSSAPLHLSGARTVLAPFLHKFPQQSPGTAKTVESMEILRL